MHEHTVSPETVGFPFAVLSHLVMSDSLHPHRLASFNFMAAITICNYFGAQKNAV